MTLVSFHRDGGTDHAGRTLDDILKFDDAALEAVHDYIQWMFPLPEKSAFQPHVPTLTPEDIETFRQTGMMQTNLRKSYRRMLDFYGFRQIARGLEWKGTFPRRAENWLTPGNHNFLRITRILRCLTLCGLEKEAKQFFDALDRTHKHPQYKAAIGNSFDYWKAQIPPFRGASTPVSRP